MVVIDRAIERGQTAQRDRLSGQKGLFVGVSQAEEMEAQEQIPDIGEWGDREKWSYEKETLGFYLTGHPLQKYAQELEQFSEITAFEVGEEISGREVSIGGMVTSVRKMHTRKGDAMATFELEDLTGSVEVLVWPNAYQQAAEYLDEKNNVPVLVRGRCEVDGRGEARLLCSQVLPFDQVWRQGVHKTCIFIPVSRIEDTKVARLKVLLNRFPGNCPVEFELLNGKDCRIRVVPSTELHVNPVPTLVEEIERLFGEKSVRLYT